VEEGKKIVIEIDNVDLNSLQDSPLLLFDAKCDEVDVNVEYVGEKIKCEEAIQSKNERISGGTHQLSLISYPF